MHKVWWSFVSGAAASPVGYVLTHSTPSLTSLRTAARASSGPFTSRTSPSMPMRRKSGFQSIRPPTPQISRPLAGESRARSDVGLDRLLEPDVDVEQAAAAARRGVAALERQPRIGGRQERDVFDRILDVEVFESGDVEVSGMKVRLDQPGMMVPPRASMRAASGPTAGASRRSRVRDTAIANENGGIRYRRPAGAIHELAMRDQGGAGCVSHGCSLSSPACCS